MNEYEMLLMLDPEPPMSARTRSSSACARSSSGRRHVGPHEVGPPQAGLRDRPQGRGHLPPRNFTCTPETLDEVSRVLRINDDVMRHMATRRIDGSRPRRPVAVGVPRVARRTLVDEPTFEARGGEEMAATSTASCSSGNLTGPGAAALAERNSVCKLRLAVNTRRKDRDRPVDRQAELLRHHGLGHQGENVAQYLASAARSRRRPPRVARVGGAGRHQAPGGRDRRREHAVPRRPRAAAEGGGALRPRRRAPPAAAADFPDRRRRRHSVLRSEPMAQKKKRAPAGARRPTTAPASARAATSARTRSKRWTTRTSAPSGATSPRRARSARAASPAPAAATRTRWPWRSSGPARWRSCRTRGLGDGRHPAAGRRESRPARRRRLRRARLRAQLPRPAPARRAGDAGAHRRDPKRTRRCARSRRRARPSRRRRSPRRSARPCCGSR